MRYQDQYLGKERVSCYLTAGAKREPVSSYEAVFSVIATLRGQSSREIPLSVKQIRELCRLSVSEKQIRAYLREYLELQKSYKGDVFRYHNRGTLHAVRRKKGESYYWESFLAEQERRMLADAGFGEIRRITGRER